MARIDDYKNAATLCKMELKGLDPAQIAEFSGSDFKANPEGNGALGLTFLNRRVDLSFPEMNFSYADSGDEVPLQEQVLILHYLKGAKRSQPSGKWVSYQDIPDGRFYLDAFLRRAKIPLVQVFGQNPDLLERLATERYGARPFEHGDVSLCLDAFAKVPVALIIWRGDDEFPPEGNILFDSSISSILSAEDIAWLAGMIIYPLIGMSKNM